ncbi:MAG: ATP-binding protein [Nitrospirae bacterium]|nr:ATP-binding protein [Nitrospirota bacterium]
MANISLIEEVVNDQLAYFSKKDSGIPRHVDFDSYLKTKQITVISGIRRSGKSTLLSQFAGRVKEYYYVNFDDERFINFSVEDFRNLMVVFQKLYTANTIFIDEVQNIAGWERFVRRLHDEGYKIFLTGSNARLLSSELATHLTGRYAKIELYPFSFLEFLDFHGVQYSVVSSGGRAAILRHFDEYLKKGGLPEFVRYNDPESLKRVYDDILYRDILVRFKIREVKAFKNLSSFIFSNFTKEMSYNSLKNGLGFKSVTSVTNYIEFMQEAYLVFELPRYDYSLKKQVSTGKKMYVIDNGLRNAVSFYFSEDSGRLLENLVYIELKRRGQEIFYFRGKNECDFLLRTGSKITEAIQVSRELRRGVNEEREIKGVLEAALTCKLKTGTIITLHQEDEIKKDGVTIRLVPVWKWLIEGRAPR